MPKAKSFGWVGLCVLASVVVLPVDPAWAKSRMLTTEEEREVYAVLEMIDQIWPQTAQRNGRFQIRHEMEVLLGVGAFRIEEASRTDGKGTEKSAVTRDILFNVENVFLSSDLLPLTGERGKKYYKDFWHQPQGKKGPWINRGKFNQWIVRVELASYLVHEWKHKDHGRPLIYFPWVVAAKEREAYDLQILFLRAVLASVKGYPYHEQQVGYLIDEVVSSRKAFE